MVTIDPSSHRPRHPVQTNVNKQASEAETHAPSSDKQTQRTNYDLTIEMLDNMSEVVAQSRRRSGIEKNAPGSVDPFERILEGDGDAEPKVERLMFVAQSNELSAQQFLVQARMMFPDDSDLILVLREIIRRRKLNNESTDVLEEVMQMVWAETNEKHTKAGMNVGIKASLFGKKFKVSSSALRNTYRDFLTSEDGELSQYEGWVEQYGTPHREMVSDFIETALIHDIQSHDPSCSREEFGMLLNHIVNFKKLRSADKSFMQVFFKSKPKDLEKEADVLTCWFDCLQRPFKIKEEIEKDQLAEHMKHVGLSKQELQQKMLRGVKLLDGELFFDPEVKEILIEALLSY